MKQSDKLNEDIRIVVKALEMDGLSEAQRKRGWDRFDELRAQLQEAYRAEAEAHIHGIRSTLHSKGAKSCASARA